MGKQIYRLIHLFVAMIVVSSLGCKDDASSQKRGMRIVKMKPTSPLHDDVRKESEKSARIGRRTIVYVGAKWCDPCVRFLKAVKAGKLDQEFGTVDILKFDLDKHGKRLKEAGYQSRLIPLFALPKADGRASDYDFSGSIKGDGAMANIMPRLRELLTNPSAINAATLSCCDGPTPKEAGAQKKGLKPLKTLELDRALGQKKPADQKRPVKTK